MVHDMLDACIIQPNRGSFSRPIVMVRKKDNAWRMCLYYKDLNKITIKDKFPIPNVDELLDELHGVVYFTNLDIKLGYHQIKLREEYITKITFRTREGALRVLGYAFSLTNAPSTFQSIMNKKI